jgi:hypothetical protein
MRKNSGLMTDAEFEAKVDGLARAEREFVAQDHDDQISRRH